MLPVTPAARIIRVRHDDGLAQYCEYRLLFLKHDGTGHGAVLRRHRPGHRRHSGRKKGNTFGATAFTSTASSGCHWWRYCYFRAPAPILKPLSAYFLMWGLFTLVMFVGTLKLNHSAAGGFRDVICSFLPAVHQRSRRQRHLVREDCRLGRYRLRFIGNLRRFSSGFK